MHEPKNVLFVRLSAFVSNGRQPVVLMRGKLAHVLFLQGGVNHFKQILPDGFPTIYPLSTTIQGSKVDPVNNFFPTEVRLPAVFT